MNVILILLSIALVVLCLFVGLIVLMQRASSNAGMGSALGGGMAESALGGEAANTLNRLTIRCVVAFFILSLGLYMGYLYMANQQGDLSKGPSLSGVAEATLESAAAPAAETAAEQAPAEAPPAAEQAPQTVPVVLPETPAPSAK